MREYIDVQCNVIRVSKLGQPDDWAWGDYSAQLPDGTWEHISYEGYLVLSGFSHEQRKVLLQNSRRV